MLIYYNCNTYLYHLLLVLHWNYCKLQLVIWRAYKSHWELNLWLVYWLVFEVICIWNKEHLYLILYRFVRQEPTVIVFVNNILYLSIKHHLFLQTDIRKLNFIFFIEYIGNGDTKTSPLYSVLYTVVYTVYMYIMASIFSGFSSMLFITGSNSCLLNLENSVTCYNIFTKCSVRKSFENILKKKSSNWISE